MLGSLALRQVQHCGCATHFKGIWRVKFGADENVIKADLMIVHMPADVSCYGGGQLP